MQCKISYKDSIGCNDLQESRNVEHESGHCTLDKLTEMADTGVAVKHIAATQNRRTNHKTSILHYSI